MVNALLKEHNKKSIKHLAIYCLTLLMIIIISIIIISLEKNGIIHMTVPVSGISVEKDYLYVDLENFEELPIEYDIQPKNASNKRVTYKITLDGNEITDDELVIKRDVITEITTPGTYTITITTVDGGHTAQILVYVDDKYQVIEAANMTVESFDANAPYTQLPNTYVFNKKNAEIDLKFKLDSGRIEPVNVEYAFAYVSDNPSVASISGNPLAGTAKITLNNYGEARITVFATPNKTDPDHVYEDGVAYTFTIKVEEPVVVQEIESIDVLGITQEVYYGAEPNVQCVVNYTGGKSETISIPITNVLYEIKNAAGERIGEKSIKEVEDGIEYTIKIDCSAVSQMTFVYVVKEIVIESITLETSKFAVDSTSDSIVVITYNDQTVEKVLLSSLELQLDTSEAGEKTLEITYGEYTGEVQYLVVAKEVADVEFSSGDQAYLVGQTINVVAKITFTDSELYPMEEVDFSFVVEAVEHQGDTDEIHDGVYVKEFYGQSFEYHYNVVCRKVVNVIVNGLEAEYKLNDVIDLNNVNIKIQYSNTSYLDEIISLDKVEWTNAPSFDTSTAGIFIFTGEYHGGTIELSYKVCEMVETNKTVSIVGLEKYYKENEEVAIDTISLSIKKEYTESIYNATEVITLNNANTNMSYLPTVMSETLDGFTQNLVVPLVVEGNEIQLEYTVVRKTVQDYNISGLQTDYLVTDIINPKTIKFKIEFMNPADKIIYSSINVSAADLQIVDQQGNDTELSTEAGEHHYALKEYSDITFSYLVHSKEIEHYYLSGYKPVYSLNEEIDYSNLYLTFSFKHSGYPDEKILLTEDILNQSSNPRLINTINTATLGEHKHSINYDYSGTTITFQMHYYVGDLPSDYDVVVMPEKDAYIINEDDVNFIVTVSKGDFAYYQIINDDNHLEFSFTDTENNPVELNTLTSSLGEKEVVVSCGALSKNVIISVLDKIASNVELVKVVADETNSQYVKYNQFKINDSVTLEFEISFDTLGMSEKVVKEFTVSSPGRYSQIFEFYGVEYEYKYEVVAKAVDYSLSTVTGVQDYYRVGDEINGIVLNLKYTHPLLYADEIVEVSDTIKAENAGDCQTIINYNDAKFTINYKVVGINSITATAGLAEHYLVGSKFNYQVLEFTVKYSEYFANEKISYQYVENLQSLIDFFANGNVTADYQFVVNYRGFSQTFKVEFIEKEISAINYNFEIPSQLYVDEDIAPYLLNKRVTISYTNINYPADVYTIGSENYKVTKVNDKYIVEIILNDEVIDSKEVLVVMRPVIKVESSLPASLLRYQAFAAVTYTVYYAYGQYEAMIVKELKAQDVEITSVVDVNTAGNKQHIIKIDGNEYKFDYNVIDINRISINNGFGPFYVGEAIDYSLYMVSVSYANGTLLQLPLNDAKITKNFKTDADGICYGEIAYYDISATVEYRVYDLFTVAEQVIYTMESINSFVVTISKNYPKVPEIVVSGRGYNKDTMVYVYDQASHSFVFTIEMISSTARVEFNLRGNDATLQYVTIKTIDITEDLDAEIIGKEYIDVASSSSLYSVDYSIDINLVAGAKTEFKIKSGGFYATLTPNYQNNTFTISPKGKGTLVVSVIVTANNSVMSFEKSIEIVDGLKGLYFSGNLGYGFVNDIYTIGTKTAISNTVATGASKEVQVFSKDIDVTKFSQLKLTTSDESIAYFEGSKLLIVGAGEVTLTATDIATGNKTDWKIRCVEGVNVTNYPQLKNFVALGPVVLLNNIAVGLETVKLTTNPDGTVTRSKAYSSNLTLKNNLRKSVSQMESTWDVDFILNAKNLDFDLTRKATQIEYILSIDNDIYGNGYELNAYNVTTIDSVADPKLEVTPRFNGPLEFVTIYGSKISGQDNICFVIRDNVTVNNVQFLSCDDAYLNTGNGFNYSKLDNVGTTVEVMGDNVRILNSRIRNGRNCLRVFGSNNPDQVINVSIESCIIQNAREFLVKLGTNKEISSETKVEYKGKMYSARELYNKGLSAVDVMDLFKTGDLHTGYTSASPYLTNANGKNYQPRNDNNLNDNYFVQNYIKTRLSIKDSTLENSRLYAIGVESKFAGPVLGGLKYTARSLDPELVIPGVWDYCYNLSGTSYAAVLKLIGDVKIYNWMKLSELDTTSIVTPSEGDKLIQIRFDISEMIKNVKVADPKCSDITTMVNGDEYVNGSIVFYGGGKNYHILDTSEYNDASKYKEFIVNMNMLGDSLVGKALPWVAGREPFRMYMYTNYNYRNQNTASSAEKYDWIPVAK